MAGESNTRIGDPDLHQAIFVAGITAMNPNAPIQALLVDPSTGQLGRADLGSFPPGPQGPQDSKGHKVRRAFKGRRGLLGHRAQRYLKTRLDLAWRLRIRRTLLWEIRRSFPISDRAIRPPDSRRCLPTVKGQPMLPTAIKRPLLTTSHREYGRPFVRPFWQH